jgi:hypothetical protein
MLLVMLAVLLAVPNAIPLEAQTLTLSQHDSSLSYLDTASLTATPRTVKGVKSTTSTVTWTSTNANIVVIPNTLTKGQTAKVAAFKDSGDGWITAQWKNTSTGVIRRDSTRFHLTQAKAASASLFYGFRANDDGKVGYVAEHAPFHVGDQFCLYTVARDKAGNVLTGKHVDLSVADTSLADISPAREGSGACPDSTVDPMAMAHRSATVTRIGSRLKDGFWGYGNTKAKRDSLAAKLSFFSR